MRSVVRMARKGKKKSKCDKCGLSCSARVIDIEKAEANGMTFKYTAQTCPKDK